MRGRVLAVAMSAASASGCFSIEPLADCADPGGLYLAYHVCMPPARAPIELPGEPQDLVLGDFDNEGVDDDVAVLLDPAEVRIFTALELDVPNEAVRALKKDVYIEGILAARLLDPATGDDLIGWQAGVRMGPGDVPLAGDLAILPNGGDMFAGAAITEVLEGCSLNFSDDFPACNASCYAPEQGVAFYNDQSGLDDVLVLGCVPDAALMGPIVTGGKLPDTLIIAGPTSMFGELKAAISDPDIRFIGPAQAADFEQAQVDAFVFSHSPGPMDDAVIGFSDLEMLTLLGPTIEPGRKGIDDVQVADFDLDGDLDILALHIEARGFSIIRQQEPPALGELAFGEPEFYTLGVESTAVALGDFTGDQVLDIAVGHSVDNETLDAISLFVLNPGDTTGLRPYASAQIGRVSGKVVGLRTMDFDGDGLTDLAVSVRDGSKGRIEFYVNRPPSQPAEE